MSFQSWIARRIEYCIYCWYKLLTKSLTSPLFHFLPLIAGSWIPHSFSLDVSGEIHNKYIIHHYRSWWYCIATKNIYIPLCHNWQCRWNSLLMIAHATARTCTLNAFNNIVWHCLVEYDGLFTRFFIQISLNHPFLCTSYSLHTWSSLFYFQLLGCYFLLFTGCSCEVLGEGASPAFLQSRVQLCRCHGISQEAKYASQWNKC